VKNITVVEYFTITVGCVLRMVPVLLQMYVTARPVILVLNVSCMLAMERYSVTHPCALLMVLVSLQTLVLVIMDTLVINVPNGTVSVINAAAMERVMHLINVGVTQGSTDNRVKRGRVVV